MRFVTELGGVPQDSILYPFRRKTEIFPSDCSLSAFSFQTVMLSTLQIVGIGVSFCLVTITAGLTSYFAAKKKSCFKAKTIVCVNSTAAAFPKYRYTQSQMKDMFIKNYCGGREKLQAKDLDFIDRVFENSLIEACYVGLEEHRLFEQMNREIYTNYVKSTMRSVACQAASDALHQSGYLPQEITHLVFGTTTPSIQAPSLDFQIIQDLSLNLTVKRLNVELMGCLTGFRLVGLCRDVVHESEHNVVLLITCDVLSGLGNQLTAHQDSQPVDKSNVISAALFRDSAGAAVFSQKKKTKNGLCVIDHCSSIIPNSNEYVVLQEFSNGSIHLYLDKALPGAAADHTPALISALLAEHMIDVSHCLFAIHAGGPRILTKVRKRLGLKTEHMYGSWYVLKNFGNLAGSNLVLLNQMLRIRDGSIATEQLINIEIPSTFANYEYIVGLSFGPGIGVECVLLKIQ